MYYFEYIPLIVWKYFSLYHIHQVALHIPGSYNLSMHLPIVIGTVPYRRIPGYLLPSTRLYEEATEDLCTGPCLPAPPPYRQTPTPPPPIDGRYRNVAYLLKTNTWTHTHTHTYIYIYIYTHTHLSLSVWNWITIIINKTITLSILFLNDSLFYFYHNNLLPVIFVIISI